MNRVKMGALVKKRLRALKGTYDKKYGVFFVIQIMLISLPWVRLEIYPRITWTDAIFLMAFGVFVSRSILTSKSPHMEQSARVYGLLLMLWIVAVLASGMNVRHVAPFLFETIGLVYLAGMSWFLAYQVSTLSAWRRLWRALAVGLAGCIGFGAIGVASSLLGFWAPIFYNNAQKLTSTFKNPNQLASFLVLFIPWLWEEVIHSNSLKQRVLYSLWLLIVLLELLSTGSRTGAVAAFVGLTLSIGWSFVQGQARSLIAGSGLFVGTMLLALRFRASIAVIQRSVLGLDALFSGQVTDAFRHHNWYIALQLFSRHLVSGYGVANIAIDYGYEIHNTYLAVLAGTGLLGAVTFLILIGYVIYLAWENVRWTRYLPMWRNVARGLFLGLLSELLFATQHLMYRERHLWVWFAFVVAFHASLQRIKVSYVRHRRVLD